MGRRVGVKNPGGGRGGRAGRGVGLAPRRRGPRGRGGGGEEGGWGGGGGVVGCGGWSGVPAVGRGASRGGGSCERRQGRLCPHRGHERCFAAAVVYGSGCAE